LAHANEGLQEPTPKGWKVEKKVELKYGKQSFLTFTKVSSVIYRLEWQQKLHYKPVLDWALAESDLSSELILQNEGQSALSEWED